VVVGREANEAVVNVIDDGPGIAASERARVFDRFYRGASSRESGSGLGLSIVKRIAELHGGSVALGDADGGGLHVAVRLPAAP
jgi:signal transduction histidine kinase